MDDSSFKEKKVLSIIIPCFNEEAVIEEMYRRLLDLVGTLSDFKIELIFVDDGSKDGTLRILKDLQSKDRHVQIVSFSRNFGHQTAVSAGLENATGDAVVLIDADLQDPPEVILEMVDLWRGGVEVVYGQREEREGESLFKLWTAKAFYRAINRMSDVSIPMDTGDFRLMDRKVVNALLSMPERDRFVRGMVAWVGFRQEPVRYKRAARFAGSTKYRLKKMVLFAIDGILSFSVEPLRVAVWVGLMAAGLSFVGILYALIMRILTNFWVPGWTLLFIALLFIGGVQLIFLGVIGEYLGRVYGEVKRRPLYLVKDRLGFTDDTTQASQERKKRGRPAGSMETNSQHILTKTKEGKKMARVRKRKVHWDALDGLGVVGYKLYWAVGKGVNYDSDFADLGNVTEVILPDDVPSFPIEVGDIELAVVAVDHIGNESDMSKLYAPFGFTAPDAPTGLAVETL